MRICPVSFYHYEPKIQPAARKHQNVPPSFTGDYYPGIYNDFCKVSPDFRYKVPEKIFQTIDSMYEKEYGIHSEFKKVDSWQSRKISNWEWERIGYKNNKVFIVHRGVESDFSDDPEDILYKYISLYEYKGNKTLEMEYMPPPRVGRGGFITAKRDYYPNSSLVEYEILNESRASSRDWIIRSRSLSVLPPASRPSSSRSGSVAMRTGWPPNPSS